MKTATNDACPESALSKAEGQGRRGHSITAGPVLVVQDKCPDAPQNATCPECGATVHLRKRKRMDGGITWFYRHGHGRDKTAPAATNPRDEQCPPTPTNNSSIS